MSREAMQMALEALESDPLSHAGLVSRKQAITILRQALETDNDDFECPRCGHCCYVDADDTSQDNVDEIVKCRHEWVGLTDEEVSYCRYAATFCDELDTAYMAELIEQALKEKNQ